MQGPQILDQGLEASVPPPEILAEIPAFEEFLHRIGFKRNEGAIYGLLVLSDKPLTSEEIEKTLHLSQSAVSNALKKLNHFGAVHTQESRDQEKRVKEHFAKEDSLAIVATVFRKREQETIEEFKRMAKRVLAKEKHTNDSQGQRAKRLQSIVSTCEMAEAVMNFVLGLTQKNQGPLYNEMIQNFPRFLELMGSGGEQVANIAGGITTGIAKRSHLFNKKLESIFKAAGESYASSSYNKTK